MTPNELRIGNFVKLRDSGEIVRVERITRRKIGFFHNNDKSRGYSRKYSEIEGISLDGLGVRFVVDTPSVQDFCFIGYEEILRCKGVKRCEYLHELQNMYHALTGEELKIEL